MDFGSEINAGRYIYAGVSRAAPPAVSRAPPSSTPGTPAQSSRTVPVRVSVGVATERLSQPIQSRLVEQVAYAMGQIHLQPSVRSPAPQIIQRREYYSQPVRCFSTNAGRYVYAGVSRAAPPAVSRAPPSTTPGAPAQASRAVPVRVSVGVATERLSQPIQSRSVEQVAYAMGQIHLQPSVRSPAPQIIQRREYYSQPYDGDYEDFDPMDPFPTTGYDGGSVVTAVTPPVAHHRKYSPIAVVEQAVQTYDWGAPLKEADIAPAQVEETSANIVQTENGSTMVIFCLQEK
ncbi:unnamed protein product [Gongylonema pulchrum]|uniref:ZM domain-containing protein n=1 Tax=Gongylonema pulchrum TaxID=637853 RepID=A0A183EMS9_9BILA|nr:unnamed protein product [Gongylonema pulchrum]